MQPTPRKMEMVKLLARRDLDGRTTPVAGARGVVDGSQGGRV